jgi:hypothetical protein
MNTIIEILIDRSGSMGYMKGAKDHENKYLLPDGSTRMSLIKRILKKDIIPTIHYTDKIVIRTFRVSKEGGKDFTDVTELINGSYQKESILEVINKIEDPPVGGTPISEAIEKSVENLKQYPSWDRKIILLTDGEENGGGDYKQTIQNIKEIKGIPTKVFIVGLNQDADAEEKSAKIASITNGMHINLTDIDYNTEQISSVLMV